MRGFNSKNLSRGRKLEYVGKRSYSISTQCSTSIPQQPVSSEQEKWRKSSNDKFKKAEQLCALSTLQNGRPTLIMFSLEQNEGVTIVFGSKRISNDGHPIISIYIDWDYLIFILFYLKDNTFWKTMLSRWPYWRVHLSLVLWAQHQLIVRQREFYILINNFKL